MNGYNAPIARFYNRFGARLAAAAAPRIRAFYETVPVSRQHKTVLDVCCGTGQLLRHFLNHGYRVTGIDLSEPMLSYARQNAGLHLAEGWAHFLCVDAREFVLPEQVGLAVSTGDSLNQFEDLDALSQCFRCVFRSLVSGGLFVFDLQTEAGLRTWNSITVEEGEDHLSVLRGIYDPSMSRAFMRISGFLVRDGDAYEHFEGTAVNTVFKVRDVLDILRDVGWERVWPALIEDLSRPLDDPESPNRVFLVALK